MWESYKSLIQFFWWSNNTSALSWWFFSISGDFKEAYFLWYCRGPGNRLIGTNLSHLSIEWSKDKVISKIIWSFHWISSDLWLCGTDGTHCQKCLPVRRIICHEMRDTSTDRTTVRGQNLTKRIIWNSVLCLVLLKLVRSSLLLLQYLCHWIVGQAFYIYNGNKAVN